MEQFWKTQDCVFKAMDSIIPLQVNHMSPCSVFHGLFLGPPINRDAARPKSKADGVYSDPANLSSLGGADLSVYDYLHGLGMQDSSIHQGQAQGDDWIGFTTRAGNTSNHLGEVWGYSVWQPFTT